MPPWAWYSAVSVSGNCEAICLFVLLVGYFQIWKGGSVLLFLLCGWLVSTFCVCLSDYVLVDCLFVFSDTKFWNWMIDFLLWRERGWRHSKKSINQQKTTKTKINQTKSYFKNIFLSSTATTTTTTTTSRHTPISILIIRVKVERKIHSHNINYFVT